MRLLNRFSIAGRLYIVLGAMATLIAGELIALSFAVECLSAVRAFIGGESMWSKAQKDSYFALQKFEKTGDRRDFDAFLEFLRIPGGDRQARVELNRQEPDMVRVREGFLAGGIDPADIDPMIRLIRRFQNEPHLSKALAIWTEGDLLLEEFKTAGIRYHLLLNDGTRRNEAGRALLRIDDLNRKLTRLEQDFSIVLGEGSRAFERTIERLLLALVISVESLGITLMFLTIGRISRGLASVRKAAEQIGSGDLHHRISSQSPDELGSLARAVDSMGELLRQSYGRLEERVQERTVELRQLAAENAKLYEEARQAVINRDEFITVASHELKTPISALNLQLGLMGKVEDPSKLRMLAHSALTQCRRLTALINELLDLTLIRQGKLALRLQMMDLTELACDVTNLMRPQATLTGSEIRLSSSGPLPCLIDQLRIGQILVNLISNAIKYGNGAPIRVEVSRSEGTAVVQVIDGGPGVRPEIRESIFNRFQRGDAGAEVSGLGLGLFIARQLALAHRGSLTLSGEPGEGSTFTLRLPVNPEQV